MRTIAIAALGGLMAAGAAEAQTKPPGWQAFADCAAAYQANAAIADPQRPAGMSSQISEVAADYQRAAVKLVQAERRRPTGQAARIVAARMGQQRRALAGQPRAAVERVIDACPQVEAE